MLDDTTVPDALLFVTPGCPHCPVVLEGLATLVKEGAVGRLEVINVAAHPEKAAQQGVRSAPWTRLGPFQFDGEISPAELRRWAQKAASGEGITEYASEQLAEGRLDKIEAMVKEDPSRAAALLPIVAEPDAPMQVRLGVAALFEALEGNEALHRLVPEMARLSKQEDRRVRGDACHLLGLTHVADAAEPLRVRLDDESEEVREIAQEALDGL